MYKDTLLFEPATSFHDCAMAFLEAAPAAAGLPRRLLMSLMNDPVENPSNFVARIEYIKHEFAPNNWYNGFTYDRLGEHRHFGWTCVRRDCFAAASVILLLHENRGWKLQIESMSQIELRKRMNAARDKPRSSGRLIRA